ncbi:DNA-binding protein [bacterium]|jgi:predicted transcriptional regulator|nr:hypothetical protein [Methanobrevibacter sp.]MBQ3407674.1 DNA-binding protein [Clostridia bacterium]MBQ3642383.1 DNA-binding protein [bacterium]MBQ7617195.1 DNA-binding protein [bacterium]
MNNTKTIKELADELGVTKDKVKYQLRKLPSELTTKKDGIIYIKKSGVKIILDNLKGKIPINKYSFLTTDYPPNQLNILQDELDRKNKQIESLQKLLDQQQNLQLQTQKMLEEKTLLLTQKQNKKWWMFWDNEN